MTMTGGGVHDGGAANIYHNHIYDPGLRPRGRPPPNGLGPSRSRAPHHTSTHTPHSQKGAGPTPTHRGRGEPYLLRGRGGWACRAGSYIYIYIYVIYLNLALLPYGSFFAVGCFRPRANALQPDRPSACTSSSQSHLSAWPPPPPLVSVRHCAVQASPPHFSNASPDRSAQLERRRLDRLTPR